MSVGVIADPMALVMRQLGKAAAIPQLLADDEERRKDAVMRQHVEDVGRDLRVRTIVESERDCWHLQAGLPAPLLPWCPIRAKFLKSSIGLLDFLVYWE